MASKENIEKKEFHVLKKLSEELSVMREELRTGISPAILASFGFIVALVWRDAIQSIINEILLRAGLLEKAYIYQIISAIIVTIIVLLVMLFVYNFNQSKKKERIEQTIEKTNRSLTELSK
jgi:uncharacterized membrane protein